MGYYAGFLQQNWFAKTKEVEAITQAPTFTQPVASVVITTQQAATSVKFPQLATVAAASAQPKVTSPDQSQKSPGYCVICTPAGKWCATKYLMPIKSDWSDLEEEKDSNEQNKKGEEIEDWDGNLENQKEWKEQKL